MRAFGEQWSRPGKRMAPIRGWAPVLVIEREEKEREKGRGVREKGVRERRE